MEAEGLLDYQGRAGIISIVRWNRRPVIFGAAHDLQIIEILSLQLTVHLELDSCSVRFG